MTRLHVLIAPDSFKGSLAATEVAQAIADGWRSVRPDDSVTTLPLADGGEGTLDAIAAAIPGAARQDVGTVTGPDRRPRRGEWLLLPDGTGVVELAQMSGIALMEQLDPLGASTIGFGQVIAAALGAGIRRLTIAVGGSASTDGGAGALAALGLTSGTGSLTSGGGGLSAVTGVAVNTLRSRPSGGVIVLTDVTAPLLGPEGAAQIFGPQKGATPAEVVTLDSALASFAAELGGDPSQPGSGAAGGAAFGFATVWDARIASGADSICELTKVSDRIAEADVVLTGEGRFDSTSLGGKLVGRVLQLAGPITVGVIAGDITSPPRGTDGRELWSASLTELAGSSSAAIRDAGTHLFAAGAQAARTLGASAPSAQNYLGPRGHFSPRVGIFE